MSRGEYELEITEMQDANCRYLHTATGEVRVGEPPVAVEFIAEDVNRDDFGKVPPR